MATRSALERLENLNERVALEKRAEGLQRALEEKEAAYEKQSRLLANAEKKFSQRDVRMEEMTKHLDQALRDRDKAERALEEAKKSHAPTGVLEKTLKEKELSYKKQLLRLGQSKDESILQIKREAEKALDERDTARQAFRLALKDLNMSQEEVRKLQTTIEGSLVERRQLIAEINIKEEQIQQRTQAIEDLEKNISEKQEIIDDEARPEEEREAAQKEVEALEVRLAELQAEKEKLEKELGLTTKEKVKRALLKYGVPLAFAIAISSVVGVILSALKATGAGVKKLGSGLTDLGKKMAASIPGLLGSVLGLVLKTGGELLKFVGNNIWILVVAIGVVLLKKMKG